MAGSRTLKLSILADVDDLKKKLDTGSKEVEGFGGKLEKFGKVAAAAFAAAAAAAAAYAVKLAVDGVKAAIEDEAAQLRLANALRNVTNATDEQIASVEKQISQMSLAFGIADDALRPAFQRLATATGDLTRAQDGLELALDISAATGKSVEAVSNALAKAYEGNTSALGRLGVGLSSAEIKSLGLDGTMKQLAETFGGAASVQANTLEGQINRLKILFQETTESVGQGLLPAVRAFLDYVTNRLIPMLIEAKNKALDPIKKAFNDNRAEIEALWKFTKTYLVPLFETALVGAIKNVGSAVGIVTNIIGAVVRGIEGLINRAIDMINALINRWNAIPDWMKPGGDVKTLSRVNFTPSADTRVGGVELPFGGGSVIPGTKGAISNEGRGLVVASQTMDNIISTPVAASSEANGNATTKRVVAEIPTLGIASVGGIGGIRGPGLSMDPDMVAPRVTINVNSASVIDQNGFTAAVVDAFNQVQARTGGGASRLVAL
jgi:hypothetical protein